jgi:hypothetical protein
MKRANWPVLVAAVVWAAVILATAALLKETSYWAVLLPILGGGVSGVLILSRKPGAAGARWSLLAVAIVWGAALLAAGSVLWATPYALPVLLLMGGGAAVSFVVLAIAQRREARA